MNNGAVVLGAEGLTLSRGNRVIYTDLHLGLSQGVTIILGPNGTGKTTLLEGLARPPLISSGNISIDGRRLYHDFDLAEYYRLTGFMPQHWAAFRGFNVQDSVNYAAWLKSLSGKGLKVAASSILVDLELTDLANHPVSKLSGGLQQRVALAEALVHNPRVAYLDEPTVGLDPEQRSNIRRLLIQQSRKRAIVISTHLIDDVETIADRVLVVNSGVVIFDGSPQALNAKGQAHQGPETGIEAGYLVIMKAEKQAHT